MNFKRIIGIVVLIIGIVLLSFGSYVKKRVAAGEAIIGRAQKSVDRADSLFSVTPYTKPVGKGITGSAQKQIDAGKQEIREYSALVKWLQIGGIVVIVIGAATIVFGTTSKPKKRSK